MFIQTSFITTKATATAFHCLSQEGIWIIIIIYIRLLLLLGQPSPNIHSHKDLFMFPYLNWVSLSLGLITIFELEWLLLLSYINQSHQSSPWATKSSSSFWLIGQGSLVVIRFNFYYNFNSCNPPPPVPHPPHSTFNKDWSVFEISLIHRLQMSLNKASFACCRYSLNPIKMNFLNYSH